MPSGFPRDHAPQTFHDTTGSLAMLAAMIYPEPEKAVGGKVAESAKFPIHPETLSKARAVVTFSRPLAKVVRDVSWASEG